MDLTLAERFVCPEPHASAPLVVRADRVEDGRLIGGVLGCATCRREWPVADGVARFGARPALPESDAEPSTIAALLNLHEPGLLVVCDGLTPATMNALVQEYGARVVALDAGVTPGATALIEGASVVPLAPNTAYALVLLRAARSASFTESAVRTLGVGGRVVGAAGGSGVAGVRELARDDTLWVGERTNETAPVPLRRAPR